MSVKDDFFLRRANPAVFYLNRDLEQMDMDTVKLPGEQLPDRVRRPDGAMRMLDPRSSALCGSQPQPDLLWSAGEGPLAGTTEPD